MHRRKINKITGNHEKGENNELISERQRVYIDTGGKTQIRGQNPQGQTVLSFTVLVVYVLKHIVTVKAGPHVNSMVSLHIMIFHINRSWFSAAMSKLMFKVRKSVTVGHLEQCFLLKCKRLYSSKTQNKCNEYDLEMCLLSCDVE